MKFRLIEHNSDGQMNWASNDDTRKFLKIGKVYSGREEIHTWHTKIVINGKKYNLVCFEEIKSTNRGGD